MIILILQHLFYKKLKFGKSVHILVHFNAIMFGKYPIIYIMSLMFKIGSASRAQFPARFGINCYATNFT